MGRLFPSVFITDNESSWNRVGRVAWAIRFLCPNVICIAFDLDGIFWGDEAGDFDHGEARVETAEEGFVGESDLVGFGDIGDIDARAHD